MASESGEQVEGIPRHLVKGYNHTVDFVNRRLGNREHAGLMLVFNGRAIDSTIYSQLDGQDLDLSRYTGEGPILYRDADFTRMVEDFYSEKKDGAIVFDKDGNVLGSGINIERPTQRLVRPETMRYIRDIRGEGAGTRHVSGAYVSARFNADVVIASEESGTVVTLHEGLVVPKLVYKPAGIMQVHGNLPHGDLREEVA